MDILWLIGFCFGVDLLCGTSFAHISVLPIPKDSNGHGTKYRFQYHVRDERGDYKTQEEAGEGGTARGSYAVQEPDGDLRIVQYTADIDGGFKAHIKVDHGGKSASKLQEIDIPAEEMRKLIEENRKKVVPEVSEIDESSKSYVLGPPRKISDIIMEQAAAIREIISKEIQAEKNREIKEKVRNEKPEEKTVDRDENESENPKSAGSESPKNIKKEKNQKINEDIPAPKKVGISPTKNSNSNSNEGRTAKVRKIEDEDAQSQVVRVALSPRKIDEVKIEDSEKPEGNNRETNGVRQSKISGGGPVQNFSFKNRIMFYKPVEKKLSQNLPEVVVSERNFQRIPELGNLGKKINDESKPNPEQEEIVLYLPYEDGEKQGDRKNKFIKVPYEVLRPYLTEIQGDEERSK